jgi:hypothetical protein
MINCLDCRHYRLERHVHPQIGVCSVVDAQLGCMTCKLFRPIVEWKHCGIGQIRCPECQTKQSIPQVSDWRHGCCTILPSEAKSVAPFRGECKCVNAEPVIQSQPVAAVPDKAKPLARSLFDK